MGAVVNSVRAGECGSSRHVSLRHQRSTTGGGPLVPETIFVPGNRIRRPETTRPKLPPVPVIGLCGDRNADGGARQFGAIRQQPGNLA
jgi:hypothetical protein